MDGYVTDASAMLALLHDEPGADAVATILAVSIVSAVNWAEVLQKARAHGIEVEGLEQDLAHLGVGFVPFTTREAAVAADLWNRGMRALSLADRACLATAVVRGLPVVTADRAWSSLGLEIQVKVIR
jgi:PIN domain nuclease of toxin-antitoxin system